MILTVTFVKTGVWNVVADVTAALPPSAVFRLPVVRAIGLPGRLLLALLDRASLLRRRCSLLLMLLLSLLPLRPLLRLIVRVGLPLLIHGPSLPLLRGVFRSLPILLILLCAGLLVLLLVIRLRRFS